MYNNPNRTVPLHFECFRPLIKSKCNGNILFEKDNDGIELILIACCKGCYNLMKKDRVITKMKENKTTKPKAKSRSKQKAQINWSTDGTEQFLIEYLSDEVNTRKYCEHRSYQD